MTTTKPSDDFESLLEFIKANRGFDFSSYKRTSLTRRFNRRMQTLNIQQYKEYTEYLEVHPEEFTLLFNSILINVTSFFRDPKAWEFLDQEILPRIIESKRSYEQIRVWSAGCATGEETYTIAILLAEKLGMNQFKQQVKIYSTDLDEEALLVARQASYPESEMGGVPSQYLEKYFDHSGGRYTFNKELRRSVIFGRHDLLQDAPISRIDLLLCRNVLMYFNAEAQTRILARINYALTNEGSLFLGKAEMLLTHASLFVPVNLKYRIFRKASSLNMRDRLLVMSQTSGEEISSQVNTYMLLRDSAFETGPVAQVVLDRDGTLTLANEKARNRFHLDLRDVGRPFQDLELSYRPVELRSAIEQAYSHENQVVLNDIEYNISNGEHGFLDVVLTPLLKNSNGGPFGICITFKDVTENKRLQVQFEQANSELETAMEELQSTNEELETTNEELQSTIEELETTNEELQSTNEELETMNEELQSTNEELETMNDELTQRSEELNHVNNFLESILTSLQRGVIVLDRDFKILIWNDTSEDLWGLRSNETVNHNLLELDIGLPVDQLKNPVREVLSGRSDMVQNNLTAINRRGREIRIHLTITPLTNAEKEIQGAILLAERLNGGEG